MNGDLPDFSDSSPMPSRHLPVRPHPLLQEPPNLLIPAVDALAGINDFDARHGGGREEQGEDERRRALVISLQHKGESRVR